MASWHVTHVLWLVAIAALAPSPVGTSNPTVLTPYTVTTFPASNAQCAMGGGVLGHAELSVLLATNGPNNCTLSPNQRLFPGYYELYPRTSVYASDMTVKLNCTTQTASGSCLGCAFAKSAVPIAQCEYDGSSSFYLQPQTDVCFGGSSTSFDVSNKSVSTLWFAPQSSRCVARLADTANLSTTTKATGECLPSIVQIGTFEQLQLATHNKLNVKLGCTDNSCSTCRVNQTNLSLDKQTCLDFGDDLAVSFVLTQTIAQCAEPVPANFDRSNKFRNRVIIICVSVAAVLSISVGSIIWCRRRRYPVYQELE
eukprot:m.487976 g.487976  ORF g.487976 m.487976 type:complete len:311 (+) comp25436_c0_seq1:287-1219(+)